MISFDRDLVFVDVETLGLDRDAPIWEFAAIRLGPGDTEPSRPPVDLAERAAIDTIDSATYPGASRWDPLRRAPKPHKEAPQRYSLDCRHSHPVGVHDLNSAPSCPSCGTGKLYYPQAIHRGYCGICSYNRPRGGY